MRSPEELTGWVRHRHPRLGFTLPLPEDWEVTHDAGGYAMVASEPDRGGLFRASLAVTAEAIEPGWDPDDWQAASLAGLEGAVVNPYVLDAGDGPPGPLPCRRALVHHEREGEAVTLERWTWYAGDRGYVLSASCATLEYDDLADLFEAVAARFSPDDGRQG